MPEELFRRYTETDSRPLTPAPTLASAVTRASGSRRCVTPDPFPTTQIKEKTLLVLDLRRSHSQETLSYYGSSSILEPPLIKIQHVHTRVCSIDKSPDSQNIELPFLAGRPKSAKKYEVAKGTESTEAQPEESVQSEEEEEEEYVKRRGKRRRKRRDASRGPPAFQVSLDPETQVGTHGGVESRGTSARPSLVSGMQIEDVIEIVTKVKPALATSKSLDVDSFLDVEILRQLRRELNEEIADTELNDKV